MYRVLFACEKKILPCVLECCREWTLKIKQEFFSFKFFTTHKKKTQFEMVEKIYVPWSADPPLRRIIPILPTSWREKTQKCIHAERKKNMQMNCKFAIFMLVNICMSLFTTDVMGVVKEGRKVFDGDANGGRDYMKRFRLRYW